MEEGQNSNMVGYSRCSGNFRPFSVHCRAIWGQFGPFLVPEVKFEQNSHVTTQNNREIKMKKVLAQSDLSVLRQFGLVFYHIFSKILVEKWWCPWNNLAYHALHSALHYAVWDHMLTSQMSVWPLLPCSQKRTLSISWIVFGWEITDSWHRDGVRGCVTLTTFKKSLWHRIIPAWWYHQNSIVI